MSAPPLMLALAVSAGSVSPAVQAPDTLPALLDSAAAAWTAGDTERARRLYGQVLAADSTVGVALHRLGLMEAWEERYEEGLHLLGRLVDLQPDNLDARVARARVRAWRGEVGEAIRTLDGILEEHPTYRPALEARARFLAWAGRMEASLSTYDELLRITSGEAGVRRSRARVLGWAERFGAAEAAYDSILARDPGDPEARLGRARILAISDRLEAAAAEYRAIVEDEPDNLEARQGLARTLTWDGELVQGEEAWEEALEVESRSVPSLVGLAQNLRWQGRNAAALAVLERARARAPRDQEIREEMRWVEAALNPRVETSLVVEDDSDENRMITTTLMARWHPSPRLGLRMDAYRRDAEQRVLDHVAQGLTFSVSYELEPGWGLIGGAGGSESDSERDDAFASWHLSVTSPWRYRVGGSAFVRSSALDATAALVRTGVRMTEFGLSGRWAPAPEWRVDATVGGASLEGVEDNGRVNGTVGVSRDLGRAWRVGLAGRAFSYDEDLSEGYFDPDFYGIVEAPARWLWQPGPWSVLVEAAPGFQQVTSGGEVRGAVRTSARLAYRIAPGREVSASGGLSSTGVQSFSTGASDYRYGAFILSLTWVF